MNSETDTLTEDVDIELPATLPSLVTIVSAEEAEKAIRAAILMTGDHYE